MVYPSRLPRALTSQEIDNYREGGAAVLRGVLSLSWIERMGRAVDCILANPGSASIEYTPKRHKGRYYGDFFVWLRDPDFKALMMDSPLPELAAQLMGSASVSFFYDQLLVKEPGTEEPTPLHQDLRGCGPQRAPSVLSSSATGYRAEPRPRPRDSCRFLAR